MAVGDKLWGSGLVGWRERDSGGEGEVDGVRSHSSFGEYYAVEFSVSAVRGGEKEEKLKERKKERKKERGSWETAEIKKKWKKIQ